MIVSTTLAGPGAERTIVDALRSCANLVEYHHVLFSGCDVAAVKAAITDAYYDGLRKVIWREYEWPNDYGAARTEALRRAEAFGADWALTVDCDERIDIDPAQLSELQNPNYDAFTVTDRDLLYQKPRFLRCGAGLYWKGECAERLLKNVQFPLPGQPPAMARMEGEFWELPKDEAAELRRAERGIRVMSALLLEEDDAHARRHLAECLLTKGLVAEARGHFEMVAGMGAAAPLFERTWCLYRLAEFSCVDGDYSQAIETASLALGRDPGLIQELGWVLAHAHAMLKDFTQAALWASYVLAAPIDYSRGGHRGKTWREGCQKLLANIEAAASRKLPPAPIRLPYDVVIPPFPTLSASMAEAMRAGRYEAREAYWLQLIVRPDDRVLELGAGCGYLSTLAAIRAPHGAVLAVEADPELVEACRATHAVNGVAVEVIHGAICGSRLGYLQRAPDFWSSRVESSGGVEVPGLTLTELAELHQPTVLVVDIEGGERHLLEERIPPTVRTILIETHSDALREQIRDWAARAGLTLETSDGNVAVYTRA